MSEIIYEIFKYKTRFAIAKLISPCQSRPTLHNFSLWISQILESPGGAFELYGTFNFYHNPSFKIAFMSSP